jgi:hypothetical protein
MFFILKWFIIDKIICVYGGNNLQGQISVDEKDIKMHQLHLLWSAIWLIVIP